MAKLIKRRKVVVARPVKLKKSSEVLRKFPKKAVIYLVVFLVVVGLIYFGFRLLFVASVNGQLVSRFTVIAELEKLEGKKTLDNVILKKLVTQEAKKNKVTITQKDIDVEIKKIEKNTVSQGFTLDQVLEQQGMTRKSLTEEIRLQLLLAKLAGDKIKVTDKEIDEYLATPQTSPLTNLTEEPTREKVEDMLKQQKLQGVLQKYLADLKAKAKINYFIKY